MFFLTAVLYFFYINISENFFFLKIFLDLCLFSYSGTAYFWKVQQSEGLPQKLRSAKV